MAACQRNTLSFSVVAPEDNKAPTAYTFINQSQGFDTYSWNLGKGETILGDSVNAQYYLSGKYDIVLSATKGKKTKQTIQQIHVNAPEKCLVRIETSLGDMLVELYDDTPLHRDNMLKLAEEGYYDDLLFHRVINGFMIQGGDPNSRNAAPNAGLGAGGPGYQVPAEFRPNLAHIKGSLAAARTGDAVNPQRMSSGSQFYIVHGQSVSRAQLTQMEQGSGIPYPESVISQYEELGGTPFLDQQYTVFGRVIEGLEIIDHLAKVETDPRDRPVENVKMKITVIK